jgi:ERF superfamily
MTAAIETTDAAQPVPEKPKKAKQQVAVREAQAAAPVAAPTSLLDIIMRAGLDPNFDIDKFERLVTIQQTEQDRQERREDRAAEIAAEAAFNAAMSEVQGQMGRVKATLQNKQTNSVYADYAAYDRMLKPLYSRAGFGLSYGEDDSPKADHVRVFCLVTHTAPGAMRSFTRRYHTDMPADGKGAKGGDVMTKTHATGSAFAYAQRYLLKLIFNVAVSKDDDGNAASGDPGAQDISALQLKELRDLIAEVDANEAAVCKACRVEMLEMLTVKQFGQAKAKLETMRTAL